MIGLTNQEIDVTKCPEFTNCDFYRQAIINGNFDIWQRGTSFSNITSSYTADRWFILQNGTVSSTTSRQAFIIGQTEVPNNPDYFLRQQVTSASGETYHCIIHNIEDVATFSGMTVTVSFYMRSDAARTVNVRFEQKFGNNGSAQVTLANQPINVTTVFTKFTLTFSVPSVSGKTIGDNNTLSLVFALPLNTACSFDIAQVQVNAGEIALPFSPRSFDEELRLCTRYFRRFQFSGTATTATTITLYSPLIPISMRVTPTITKLGSNTPNGDNGMLWDITSQANVASVSPLNSANLENSSVWSIISNTSVFTIGHMVTGSLWLDAEL